MISKNWHGRSLVLCVALTLLAGSAQLGLPTARAQEPMGHVTVTGKIKINGQPAATGDIVSSGNTLETAKGSSAVVSLGKLGRVEVLPATLIKLRYDYDDASISILVEAGGVKVATGPGVSATVRTLNCLTPDGKVVRC